jgi:hypothetical protein
MPNGLFHPFTKALYEQNGDGNILVTDGDSQGIFGPDGRWISGELRECDPQMCNWIAGPIVANHRVGSEAGQETHRPES